MTDFATAANPSPESEAQASESVREVIADLTKGPVTAKDFFASLCEQHSDYIGGKAGDVVNELHGLVNSDGQRQLAAEQWVEQARRLFRRGAVQWLDTRVMILALALLDADLFQLLSSRERFVPLFKEIAGDRKAETQVA